MSAGLITSDEITTALQRAKELAAVPSSNLLKRSAADSEENSLSPSYPSKRPYTEMDGQMQQIASLGMPYGGPGGPPMGNGNESVVEVINVPDNTVGLVIGRGGEQIQQIQAQSGARVQMSPDGSSDPTSGVRACTLQGTRAAVERAKMLIQEVINRANNRPPPGSRFETGGERPGQITEQILIPGTKCGLIIGKQGETIKALQDQAGVKMVMIQETQEVSGNPKPLRITGDPDKVEHAKRLVNEILNSRDDGPGGGGPRHFGGHENTAKGEVVVPRASVGMIIGKGGEMIKRLAMQTGTKIQFKPDDDPTTPDRCAVILGTREQIYRATELITELGGGQEVFYMHVPANKTGLVIGKGGETIKQICSESGAHVELSRDPPPNASEKVFVIKGTPYQIHHAQHIIRVKVGDLQPGTPVPHFTGPGAPIMGGPHESFGNRGQGTFGGSGATFGGMPGNQWNNSFGQQPDGQGNNWPTQQQPQQFTQFAGQTYGAPQQPAGNGYAHAQPQQQPQYTAGAAASGPTINPQTGQPDYSAQWAEYYRSVGMHEQAALIDQQIKNARAGGAAAAGQQATGIANFAAGTGGAQPAQAAYGTYGAGQGQAQGYAAFPQQQQQQPY